MSKTTSIDVLLRSLYLTTMIKQHQLPRLELGSENLPGVSQSS
jgi:hypothetical protein